MAKEEIKEEKKDEIQPQREHFAWNTKVYGISFVAALVLFFFYTRDELQFNYFTIGLIIIVLFVFIIPMLIQAQLMRVARTKPYINFKPETDIPLIEKMLFDCGKRIKIARWTCEPRYGEGSVAPRNITLVGSETLASGVLKPVLLQMNVLNRNITSLSNDYSRIESLDVDWSGAKKYDTPSESRLFYVPRTVFVRPASVAEEESARSGKKEKEEEGEEERGTS